MTSASNPKSGQSNTGRPSTAGRCCTRSSCKSNAVATLTYIYSDSTAVLGPLSTFVEPHAYDLCESHSERLTVPKGWIVVEHQDIKNKSVINAPSPEDVLAIAEAIRQTAKMEMSSKSMNPEVGRRGHLRSIPQQD